MLELRALVVTFVGYVDINDSAVRSINVEGSDETSRHESSFVTRGPYRFAIEITERCYGQET